MMFQVLLLLGGFLTFGKAFFDFEEDGGNALRRTKFVVDGFVDTEACYSAMETSVAKKEGDRRMDPETYVTFVKEYGPDGFLEGVTEFSELPLILKSNFNTLACLCQQDSSDTCCVGNKAGIETDGSFSDEIPSTSEQSYLFLVCSLTSVSIDRVIESSAPSSSPTITPYPTYSPTISPAPTSPTISPAPTPMPSKAPIIDGSIEREVFSVYGIGVKGNATFDGYKSSLIKAMDSLAPLVLAQQRRKLQYSRRLQSVLLPTAIFDFQEIDCPAGVEDDDRCEEITANIILMFQPTEDDPEEIVATFSEDLQLAIFNGELQEMLDSDEVYILDQSVVGALPPSQSEKGVSGGGIAGAVIGSLAAIVLIAYFVSRRGEEKEELEELRAAPKDNDMEDVEGGEVKAKAVVKASGTLGPTKKDDIKPEVAEDDEKEAQAVDNMSIPDDASSSNAGSSGWSSSAGLSSMNTGSADGLDVDKVVAGVTPTLEALNERVASSDALEAADNDGPSIPSVTRADLDNAIEAGDWAAVGATAALLAAASDSQSYSSRSEQFTGTRSRSGSSVSSIDAARAAELDHLVDAGDWEGVVLAAAKYEDEGKESLPSESISGGSESRSNTDTAGQTADSSIASSKGLKRQEYRAIVEDLVQRVVPEEIQNVDEMMMQFRGREDELVETLRTMQERAVAQKARHSSQKAAKQQAKMASAAAKAESQEKIAATSSKSIGTGHVSAQASAKSLGTGQVETAAKSKSLGTGLIEEAKNPGKQEKKQSALEAAIEAGDWDAVGEAAAILTDNSMASSADTDEINRLAEGLSTDGSSAAGSRGNSEAAEELEELIEAGDWTGVVQAATARSSSARDSQKESEDARRQRRLKHLQEEQEALAQAEIWTAIAEQSRQEAETTDQGAADAADWAITRSLNALVEAEQSGLNDPSTEGGSVPGSQREDDDDDVSGNEV